MTVYAIATLNIHDREEYQALLQHRLAASSGNVAIIEGLA